MSEQVSGREHTRKYQLVCEGVCASLWWHCKCVLVTVSVRVRVRTCMFTAWALSGFRVVTRVCESPACASVLVSYDAGRMFCADVFLCGMFMAIVCCWRDKCFSQMCLRRPDCIDYSVPSTTLPSSYAGC